MTHNQRFIFRLDDPDPFLRGEFWRFCAIDTKRILGRLYWDSRNNRAGRQILLAALDYIAGSRREVTGTVARWWESSK